MPERALPISKKQYDTIDDLQRQQRDLAARYNLVCGTIVQGHDLEKELGNVEIDVAGVRAGKNGVYELVLVVPEAKPAKPGGKPTPKTAAKKRS